MPIPHGATLVRNDSEKTALSFRAKRGIGDEMLLMPIPHGATLVRNDSENRRPIRSDSELLTFS